MKYLIFGRQEGWLAQKFNNYLNDSLISDVDIRDLNAVKKVLKIKKPQIVINAAGITGRPNIDWCETHKIETIQGNVLGPLNILSACLEQKIYWVHLSSGCVFQGEGPGNRGFRETDPATPPSFYSLSKYLVDEVLKNFPVLILRLRLPIDNISNPRNLIDKLAKYPKIIDVKNSVTIIDDLLFAAKKLMDKKKTGIYHIVNPGVISHKEIMTLYKKYIKPSHQYKLISVSQLYRQGLAKAGRSNCVLNTDKLQKEGIRLKPIKKRIIEIFEEYKKNLN